MAFPVACQIAVCCSFAEVLILGIDIDEIGTGSLGATAVLLLGCLVLPNQIPSLTLRIPANPEKEGKAIPRRDTVLPQAVAL